MNIHNPWIDVNVELPVNNEHSHNTEVIGLVSPYGDVYYGTPEFVHFDGEDWYDRDGRTCTVTYWIPLNFEYLVYLHKQRRR